MSVFVTDGPGPFRRRAVVTFLSERIPKRWTGREHTCRKTIGTLFVFSVSLVCLLSGMGCDEGTGSGLDPALSRGVSADRPSAGINGGTPASDIVNAASSDDEPAAGTFVPGRLLVKFKPGASAEDQHRVLSRAAGARVAKEIPQIGVKIIELPPNASEAAQLRAFGQQSEVEFAELDRIVPPAMVPNDLWYANWQWGLRKVECPTAWDATIGSDQVVIAILDSGVDSTHSDLAPKLVAGWNIYNNNSDTTDVTGHGTAVAGVAGAASNNTIGVASVAWGCPIMPVRVSENSGCASYWDMSSGLIWAADHGAKVANLSFLVNSSAVTSAAQYFQSRGGVVVTSAGNEIAVLSTPDDPSVLNVSATTYNDTIASYSNIGNNIDLAAPGVATSTILGGGYYDVSGTSISAPYVAGAVALTMSANSALTCQQIQGILVQSADDLGPAGWDPTFGWGRLNVGRAVAMAIDAGGPIPDNTPPTCSFSAPSAGASVSGTTNVLAIATDNVGVASVRLYVDGGLLATDTTVPYGFAWNTINTSNGSHTLEARAADAAGNIATTVILVNVNNVNDATPPTIAITSPLNGASVGNRVVNVTVNVSDNVGVTRVELYVDGAIKSTSTSAPFTTSWNPRRAASGAHSLQTRGYDAVGNVGTSAIVTVYR